MDRIRDTSNSIGSTIYMNITRMQNRANWCYRHRIPLFPQIICHLMRIVYSCEIPHTATIDPTVRFAHKGLGVVVGHNAVIGKNTKILNNVTIGGRGGRKDNGGRSNPLIGEGVLIGAGACLLGPITIADHVSIGANAVVIDDILEPYAVVVGVPAKIVKITNEDKSDEGKELPD